MEGKENSNKPILENNDDTNKENIISPELIKDIEEFYRNALKEDIDDGFMEEADISRKVEGEKSFFLKVLNSVDSAVSENKEKKVVVLFDLDETLARNNYDNDNKIRTKIRPSALDLFRLIREKKVDIGFLTGRAELSGQLDDGLKSLKDFINEDYLFSSRDVSCTEDEEKLIKENVPDHLKKYFSTGDCDKIKLLNGLISKKEYVNNFFLPVDDGACPRVFKNGVYLEGDETFFI